MRSWLLAITAAVSSFFLFSFPPPPTSGATVPSGFTDAIFMDGINFPTAMEFAPDGRLFVTEFSGQVRIIKNGTLLPTPFATLPTNAEAERGLLGITLDPAFAENGYVYVFYVADLPNVPNRISRLTSNGDVAVPGSEVILFEIDSSGTAPSHDGGSLHFGPDGKLYIGSGENYENQAAQDLNNLKGKVLRINKDGSIPADNPFYATATGNNRAIWAYGFRNPFTFAFQQGTGRMFINDVGSFVAEEINEGVAGANYGWPLNEGPTTTPGIRSPFHSYPHYFSYGEFNGACALAGSVFYHSAVPTFPAAYHGKYFYSDLCGNFIRVLDPVTGVSTEFAKGLFNGPVDLDVGPDGALYYLQVYSGNIGRIQYGQAAAPVISLQPSDKLAGIGQAATFAVSASGVTPLSYQWSRNGAPIPGATASSYTLASVSSGDNGATFQATVTNALGSVSSRVALLNVPGNAPAVSIQQPAAGTTYGGGQSFNVAASATDAEDGTLGSAAFTWKVDLHHDNHSHPFMQPATGSSGSFTIPTTGETSTNVFYRLTVSARDSSGLVHQTIRDILPRTSTVQLVTQPPGLQLTVDGTPATSPQSVLGVSGISRQVGTPQAHKVGRKVFHFQSWSDGGDREHAIAMPATSQTLTAIFVDKTRLACGDVNQDHEVNWADYLVLFWALLYQATDSDYDVNGDGSVDWGDLGDLFWKIVFPC